MVTTATTFRQITLSVPATLPVDWEEQVHWCATVPRLRLTWRASAYSPPGFYFLEPDLLGTEIHVTGLADVAAETGRFARAVVRAWYRDGSPVGRDALEAWQPWVEEALLCTLEPHSVKDEYVSAYRGRQQS